MDSIMKTIQRERVPSSHLPLYQSYQAKMKLKSMEETKMPKCASCKKIAVKLYTPHCDEPEDVCIFIARFTPEMPLCIKCYDNFIEAMYDFAESMTHYKDKLFAVTDKNGDKIFTIKDPVDFYKRLKEAKITNHEYMEVYDE